MRTTLGSLGFALLCVGASSSQAQETLELASSSPAGERGDGESLYPALSQDGRYLAFCSFATNLVAGDANGSADVFVRDLDTGIIELASVSDSGARGNANSGFHQGGFDDARVALSGDGRFVAFTSFASNLVAGDTNGAADVFVRDRIQGTTRRVSLTSAGTQVLEDCLLVAMSEDGNRVLIRSSASNLAPGDTDNIEDLFVQVLQSGQSQLVSIGPGGESVSYVWCGYFLNGGESVLFYGYRSIPAGRGGAFIRDCVANTTVPVIPGAGWGGPAPSWPRLDIYPLSVSDDGRWVVVSSDQDLDPSDGADSLGEPNLWLLDRSTSAFERLTIPSGDQPWTITPDYEPRASVTDDGNDVLFFLCPSGLLGWNPEYWTTLVLQRDRLRATTVPANLGAWMRPAWTSMTTSGSVFSASADHRVIAFISDLQQMPEWWQQSQGLMQVYVRKRPTEAARVLCAGDGSGAACPCANFGHAGHGCGNVMAPQGASLTGRGNPSLSDDTLVLYAADMESYTAGMLLQSVGLSQGGQGLAFGAGLSCLATPVMRLELPEVGGGTIDSFAGIGHTSTSRPPISQRGFVTVPGTRYYQFWYRSWGIPACTASTLGNFTNALRVDWTL